MPLTLLPYLVLSNVVVDTLANASSRFTPLNNGFTVENPFQAFCTNNVTNWRVFNDDSQLIDFLTNVQTCSMIM
jgi:hypothetical protein